jgi:hypothetical protein
MKDMTQSFSSSCEPKYVFCRIFWEAEENNIGMVVHSIHSTLNDEN